MSFVVAAGGSTSSLSATHAAVRASRDSSGCTTARGSCRRAPAARSVGRVAAWPERRPRVLFERGGGWVGAGTSRLNNMGRWVYSLKGASPAANKRLRPDAHGEGSRAGRAHGRLVAGFAGRAVVRNHLEQFWDAHSADEPSVGVAETQGDRGLNGRIGHPAASAGDAEGSAGPEDASDVLEDARVSGVARSERRVG